jgi:hypothetical protein
LYFPDSEIASDFAALLTLLCRRLVTVAGKVREQYECDNVPAMLADFPIPVATMLRRSHWKPRPIKIGYSLDGVTTKSYAPPIRAFDSGMLMNVLLALPKMKTAFAIIRAARLYASAMEQIESQYQVSYQLLISAVEALAGTVLEDWQPDEKEKIDVKSDLISHAMKVELLSQNTAERLAIAACKNNPWSKRKFKKFLIDNLDTAAISREDDLFIVPQPMCPKEDEIEKALGEIYQTRSQATHQGHSYPVSASIGPSPYIPSGALACLINEKRPFPPIGWFERVVNNAFVRYIESEAERVRRDARPNFSS